MWEIIRVLDGTYDVLERDNGSGDFAELKTQVKPRLISDANSLVSNAENSVYGVLPDLKSSNGGTSYEPEGVAITSRGATFVVTDNNGVDGWSGETWFLDLGKYRNLFRYSSTVAFSNNLPKVLIARCGRLILPMAFANSFSVAALVADHDRKMSARLDEGR